MFPAQDPCFPNTVCGDDRSKLKQEHNPCWYPQTNVICKFTADDGAGCTPHW